jgi:hypothetical protein
MIDVGDDLAARVPLFDMSHGLRRLPKWIAPGGRPPQ